MNLTIVIATHNSWPFLQPCLESVYADCGADVEVVVVDNASTDQTRKLLSSTFPRAVLISNPVNYGHCRAINQGICRASRDYIMVLDADTILCGRVGETVVDFLIQRPDVAVVAPRIENSDGSLQPTARKFPRPINGLFGRQSLLTRWLPGNRVSRRYLGDIDDTLREPYAVEFVSSACMAFPKRLTESLGLWDEGFRGYWVDADWCKRALNRGAVYCLPQVTVVHHEQNRRGVRKGSARIMLFHHGVNRFYRKHYTLGYLDPRALCAAALLSVRAALLMLVDIFLPPAPKTSSANIARVAVGAGEESK